ncbi:hypothetical protein F511_23306 [Dorcoceras hygrometricum]|uniref:Uncharacterized protein n=1 Tax=Dorcoceras hygrometricum TaxID=472368 RepID=A0A2Z7A9X1_9LAMI|nr:hypothetical protein F511_23306 [Dorcoceras hygrometricum]
MTSALMSSQSADGFQQMMLSAKEKRRRIVISADDENQQMKQSTRAEAMSRKKMNQSQATAVLPVESLFVSAVATLLVVVKSSRLKRRSRRSEEIQPVARFSRKIQQKRKISSSRLESAGAKQLTTYEELRKLDVNC